jgi:hypothetical protein
MEKQMENLQEMNYRQLLHMLTLVDAVDGPVEITDEDYQKILGKVSDKVDAIKFVQSKLEAEVDRLKKIEKQFTDSRRACENNLERLKKYVIYSMEQEKLHKIQGKMFKLQLFEKDSIDCKDDINQADFLKVGMVAPGCIDRKFSWNKTKVKEAIKSPEGAGALMDYIKINVNRHIRWGVMKDE